MRVPVPKQKRKGGCVQVEALLSMRYEITSVVLFSIGFMTLLLHPNLIKKIIGLNIMDTAVYLFLAASGYIDGGYAPVLRPGEDVVYINPLPSSLVLTGIVVSMSVTALLLALALRLYRKYNSLDLDVIVLLAKQGKE